MFRNDRSARRGFLARLLGGATAFGAAGLTVPGLELGGAPDGATDRAGEFDPALLETPGQEKSKWDMSWVDRLTGKYKQVFDAPEIAEGTVFHQVRLFTHHYAEVMGTTDTDTSAVMVIRHTAIPLALNDALWDEFELGREAKLKDPTTGRNARRHPFMHLKEDDKYSLSWPDGGLDTLISKGAIVLACDLALGRFAGEVMKKSGLSRDDARKKVMDNLVPGVVVQPSGVFGVIRAQQAGCNYIRAT